MDSVTQIVLGAAVGEAVMGKKIGNKAQLLGAIAGTVPDLDVVFNLFVHDEVLKLQIHRSWSHAVFFHILLAIPFAMISYRLFKRQQKWMDFYWLWFLGFFTHALLDCFTTYGTQLFQPFSDYLVGFNNVSVVDPLYTLPFMVLLGVCLFIKKENPLRARFLRYSLVVSSFYMVLTFGLKYIAHEKMTQSLVGHQMQYNELSTSPTIFNSILWAGMALQDSSIMLSEYSLVQKNPNIEFVTFSKGDRYLKPFKSHATDVLLWFSQGKYMVTPTAHPDTLNFYVCKWGKQDFTQKDPALMFRFYYKLYKNADGSVTFKPQQELSKIEFKKGLIALWQRIFND